MVHTSQHTYSKGKIIGFAVAGALAYGDKAKIRLSFGKLLLKH